MAKKKTSKEKMPMHDFGFGEPKFPKKKFGSKSKVKKLRKG